MESSVTRGHERIQDTCLRRHIYISPCAHAGGVIRREKKTKKKIKKIAMPSQRANPAPVTR